MAPCDNHHSSEEEEEVPSPGSPTDSQQRNPSSHAEHNARREANKWSHEEEVENKDNQTKRKAKTKKAGTKTSKEGLPTPVLSISHSSMVIDCLECSMVPLYREQDGCFVQAGWAPLSKEKPVVLANSKNSPIRG